MLKYNSSHITNYSFMIDIDQKSQFFQSMNLPQSSSISQVIYMFFIFLIAIEHNIRLKSMKTWKCIWQKCLIISLWKINILISTINNNQSIHIYCYQHTHYNAWTQSMLQTLNTLHWIYPQSPSSIRKSLFRPAIDNILITLFLVILKYQIQSTGRVFVIANAITDPG